MTPFVWGSDGQKKTPQQVERERLAAALMARDAQATTPVASPFAGLNRALQGYISGRDEKRSDAAEAAGMAGADAAIAGLSGGMAGGPIYAGSMGGQPVADPRFPIGQDSVAPPNEMTPGGLVMGVATHDHASHAGQSHADWLKYSNQSATRNDPLDPALVESMSFLGDMGITMDVVSGGQEPAGAGGSRTGSTRHDHGKAADVDFYMGGRKLDWNNPQDLPVLQEIVSTAKSRGVAGIGAGDDYMGAGRFHIGFGEPAVWGAGGKGENAPAWLVEAYNGAPSGGNVTMSASGGAPTGGTDLASLLALSADPWVTQKYGGVIDALTGQAIQQRDPLYQAQLAAATRGPGPSEFDVRAQAAAEFGLDPMALQSFVLTGQLPGAADQPKPIEVGGVLLDPVTFQPIYDSRQPGGDGLINAGNGQIYDPNTGSWISAPAGPTEPMSSLGKLEADRTAGLISDEAYQAELSRMAPQGMTIESDGAGGFRMVQGPAGVSGKPLTEAQSKDTVYATRASGALPIIDSMEQSFLSFGDYAAGSLPAGLGNYVQSEEYQVAQNAGKEFLASILRKDTGAAVTPSEEKLYGDIFLPRPGDKPATLTRKKQARALALEAIKAGMPVTAIENMAKALEQTGFATPAAPLTPSETSPKRRVYNPATGAFE